MNKIAVKHRLIKGVMLTQVHCTNFITVMAVHYDSFAIKYMERNHNLERHKNGVQETF